MDPITALIMIASLFGGFAQDYNRKKSERKAEIQYQEEKMLYEEEKQRLAAQEIADRAYVEKYNSPLEQKKRLEAAGLNPYAFLQGGGGNTSMLSLDFSSSEPDRPPPPSEESATLNTLLNVIFPSLLKMSMQQSETQNQMLMLQREVTEENMFDEDQLDALLKESRIINAIDRSELSSERLEQMRKDNLITQQTIDLSEKVDKLADKIYKSGRLPTAAETKELAFLLSKLAALKKLQ